MKINVDDWHFRPADHGSLIADLFLENGQHAILEVNPMHNREVVNGQIPELIVFGEIPGEKVTDNSAKARWIARPPHRDCPWSNVQLPPIFYHQVQQHLPPTPSTQTAPPEVHPPI